MCCVFISPAAAVFASGSFDQTAKLWYTERVFPLRTFIGHTRSVNVSRPLSFCALVSNIIFSVHFNFAIFLCRNSLHFSFSVFPIDCTDRMTLSRCDFLIPHSMQAELRHLQQQQLTSFQYFLQSSVLSSVTKEFTLIPLFKEIKWFSNTVFMFLCRDCLHIANKSCISHRGT